MLDGHLFEPVQAEVGSAGANLRLLIYISCLISVILLALQLAALAYNRAHARRLLGAIPAHPPPPLLVTNLRAANSQQQIPAANCSDQTTPTYSSSDYSLALQASKTRLEQQQFGFGAVVEPLRSLFPPNKSSRRLIFPIHLIVQLFALELLIVFLVESQNYLQRPTRISQHAHLLNMSAGWQPAQFFQFAQMQHQENTFPASSSDQLNPIGWFTWLLVLALYYLIASVTCWLFGQLLKLNLSLLSQHWHLKHLASSCSPSSSGSSSAASDKSIQYGATNSTAISSSANPAPVSIYSQQQQQNHQRLPTSNLYGGANSCYGQYNTNNNTSNQRQLNNLQSSTSPTSSFSSTGNQSMSDPNTALSRLEADSNRLYGEPFTLRLAAQANKKGSSKHAELISPLKSSLIKLSLDKLYLFVVHILPILSVLVIGFLSTSKSDTLNALTYTTSSAFQLAHWPLLVEFSSTPFAVILYYVPSVSELD